MSAKSGERSMCWAQLPFTYFAGRLFQVARVRVSADLSLRKQINCNQREQKVGNKHRRTGIFLRDSLPKK